MKNVKKLLTTVILSATLASHVMVAEQTGNVGMPSTSTTVVDAVAKPNFWDKLKVGFSKGKAELQNSKLGKVAADNPRAAKNIAIGAGALAVGAFAYKCGLFSKAWSTAKKFVKKHPYLTTTVGLGILGNLGYFANKGSFGVDVQGYVRNVGNSIFLVAKHGWNWTASFSNAIIGGCIGASLVENGVVSNMLLEQKNLRAQKVAQRMLDVAVSKRLKGSDDMDYAVSAVREVYDEGVVGNLSVEEIKDQLVFFGFKTANMNNALYEKAISDLLDILTLA